MDEVGCIAILPVVPSHGETMVALLRSGGSCGEVADTTGKSRQWVHHCAKEMMDRLPKAIADRDEDEQGSGALAVYGELCGRNIGRNEALA